MNEPQRAVFVSYASQDAEAAARICNALSAAGVEVWFDQSALRGGEAWDSSIRKQIKACTLFIPVISANSHARVEGYFRLEWKLAVDRSHLIAPDQPFLLPLVIDDTPQADERIPERFRELQWTRAPGGQTAPAFVERVLRLLSRESASGAVRQPVAPAARSLTATREALSPPSASRSRQPVLLVIAAAALAGVGYLAFDKFILSKPAATGVQSSVPGSQSRGPTSSDIPEKSIAVLPFVNMSSDKEQEYFSDGLTEEMIDLLGQVPGLRVPARTSSFYFKGKNETIANMAQQLKVANVLEGSVRKAGKRLRITAQLVRADNGYQRWSQTYDREDADVFAVQDDIAKAVVNALQVNLAGEAPATGGRETTNTQAYNQYLLGRQLDRRDSLDADRLAVEAYRQAIELDPNYAAAYAGLAVAEASVADYLGDAHRLEIAGQDADKAIKLAPGDAIGYSARGYIRTTWLWDWPGAQADTEKALSLGPRNSDVQHRYARLLFSQGRQLQAIAAQKKATELDPLSSNAWENLGHYYTSTGDYGSAEAALSRAIELEPTSVFALNNLGTLRLVQGKGQEALDAFRKMGDVEGFRSAGIAMAEHTLGHAKESQQALQETITKHAQEAAYQIAEILAWRGEKDQAFEWLERAYKQRDGGLSELSLDPLMKALRPDPRLKTMLHKMRLLE